MATSPHAPPPGRDPGLHDHGPSPLWAVLTFTFLNSIGGGVVTTGFAFLAESAYGFTPAKNYLLGLLQGGTYIIGALAAGPALRRAYARHPVLSERTVLAGLMVVLAALCAVPWFVRRGAPPTAQGHSSGAWAIWLLIAGYSTLTGVLWPIVESFMSGGRSERSLRRTIGAFNIVWSSALPLSFWAMAPLLKPHPLVVILGVSGVHLASMVLLPAFRRSPGRHPLAAHEQLPPVYRRLLVVFRFQLPVSYLAYSALGPYLPAALATLGLPDLLRSPTASIWLLTRTLTFALLQAWHGWHGRWATTWVGCLLLLLGFGAAVLSPRLAGEIGRPAAIAGLITGLALFGIGMGVVYFAALYYALEVGRAKVDAGGTHEALIGVGYLGGPACGLAAAGSVSAGLVSKGAFEVTMLLAVSTLAFLAAAYSFWRAWHSATDSRSPA